MNLAAELRKAGVLFLLTARYLLMTRRGIVTALLAMIPVLVVVSLAAARVEAFDIFLFQALLVPLFLQVVLIFVTLVQAGSLIREEIEDETLPYLITRPVSKPAIVLYKFAGYAVSALVLLVPPLVLSYGITKAYTGRPFDEHLDVLAAFLAVTVLGVLAYGAFFTLLSVATRRPLFLGLLFGFVWEGVVGSIPGDVPKLSIIYYLRSVMADVVVRGPLASFPTDADGGVAAAVLLVFTGAALALAMFVFRDAQFMQKS